MGKNNLVKWDRLIVISLVVLIVKNPGYMSPFRVKFGQNCTRCHPLGWAQKPLGAKLHSLPFTRISQKSTRLRLVLFWLILVNGNSCNFMPCGFWAHPREWQLEQFFAKKHSDPKIIPKKRPRLRLGLFLGIIFGSSCFFSQISPKLHFAGVFSNKKPSRSGLFLQKTL